MEVACERACVDVFVFVVSLCLDYHAFSREITHLDEERADPAVHARLEKSDLLCCFFALAKHLSFFASSRPLFDYVFL